MIMIFSFIWKYWLYDSFTRKQCKVIQITGWNSCLLDSPSSGRQRRTFIGMPWAGARK